MNYLIKKYINDINLIKNYLIKEIKYLFINKLYDGFLVLVHYIIN